MKYKEFAGKEVIVMACSDCNTKCKHCYIGYEGNLTHKDLADICDELNKKYKVRLNGTELLLHPEYFGVLRDIGQKFIITNGIELVKNPNIVYELVDIGIKYVGISYHFFIQSEISEVKKSLIENTLKRLKDFKIITEIKVTINSKNFDKVEEICKEIIDMGANGVKFTNYMYTGNALHLDEKNVLSEEQIAIFFNELEKVRNKYPKGNLLIRRCGSFGMSKYRVFNCTAINKSVVITPDMNVYPCIFLARKGLEIGRFEDGKILLFRDIWHDGKRCLAKELNNQSLDICGLVNYER